MEATLEFFRKGWILPYLNSDVIVLIPKLLNVDKIENYRPIALVNFQFKIITKVLTNRLSNIAPRIISSFHRGFIKGKHFSYYIAVTLEEISPIKIKIKKCLIPLIGASFSKCFDLSAFVKLLQLDPLYSSFGQALNLNKWKVYRFFPLLLWSATRGPSIASLVLYSGGSLE